MGATGLVFFFMATTSLSLLERLRRPDEHDAWRRFVDLYTPLLYYWARRVGLQQSDAADLVQDVLATLVQKLPEFQPDGQRSFRSWLRTVTLNKWRDRCRRATPLPLEHGRLDDLPGPDPAEEFEEAEYRQRLVSRAMELMKRDFAPQTWKACWEHVVSGRPAAEVGAELGLSAGAVYAAKFRVLNRLRQELSGLLD